jgi:VWFA-related protein
VLAVIAIPHAWAQTEPVFRSTSEVVLVPASVLDKHGQPVSGLKREDFELRVDGKPAAITALDEVSGPPAATHARPALAPNTVTNVVPVESSRRSWVVLLVDFINTAPTDRMELRKQLLKFLAKDLRPGQQIAIYALSSSLVLLHPFTSDTQELIAAASRLVYEKGTPAQRGNADFLSAAPAAVAGVIAAGPGGSASLAAQGSQQGSGRGDIEYFLLASQWRQEVFTTHTRAANTLAQFRQLANSFAGVPGKKMVLWLTGDASPLNPTLMNQFSLSDPGSEPLRLQWRDVAATYEALNGAGISLFPVDIRGITNAGLANPGETPNHPDFMQNLALSQPGDVAAYPTTTSRRQGESANAVMAMETAAVETGGQVLKGSNDLSELLGRAEGLWSSYYVLSFTPEEAPGGKSAAYHRIEVKVPGRAAQVLYRRGYTTRPESLIASKGELARDVADAAASPVDLTGIPLTLKLAPEESLDSSQGPRFLLAIQAAALERADTPKGSRYDFSIFILLKDSKGKALSNLGDKIDRVFSPSEAAGIARHGFLYPGRFDAPASERSFGRIIVRDNLSGRVGTITVQIGHD